MFLSGAVWAWLNYFLSATDLNAAKALSLKIHGAAAMATLVLIGVLLHGHVRFAWSAYRNRANGVVLLSALGVLLVTGYGLYYAGNERLRAWTSWIHLGLGLVLPALLVGHIVVGRRSRPDTRPLKPRDLAL